VRTVEGSSLVPGSWRRSRLEPSRRRLTGILALLALTGADAAQAADIEAGRQAAQPCFACHGEDGISKMDGVPSLAGLADNFLQWQMVFFRTGRRKNEIMQPQAAGLSDSDIKNLGAFFASLAPPGRPQEAADVSAPTEPGKVLSTQRRCNSCHGDSFTGIQAAPRLAWQREEYLAKALSDYRSGARPSSAGAVMTEIAAGLSEPEMEALAHYLANMP
jgi:cytochrome c553